MLHSSARGRRRLYRKGDPVHPERKGKIYPERRQLPERYRPLVDWYLSEYNSPRGSSGSSNPAVLLGFVGLISAYDLGKMSEAIAAGCEQIDASEW
jgi:hypothetical protein